MGGYGVDPHVLRGHVLDLREDVVARVRAAAELARSAPGDAGTGAALRGLAALGDGLAALVHASADAYDDTEAAARDGFR